MNRHLSNYVPPVSDIWTGRDDVVNGRLFQRIQMLDCRELCFQQLEIEVSQKRASMPSTLPSSESRRSSKPQSPTVENIPETFPKSSIVFLGFACDEGVRRNCGRVGATKGPESLRKALRNIPLHDMTIWDAGTVICTDHDLETAQLVLGEIVAELRRHGAFVIVLGGGHEVAWGNFQGLIKDIDKEHGLDVINFDAHFDLRPLLPEQKGSSGTGFRQMYDYSQENKMPFRYACLGVQPLGNTAELFHYADSINAHYYLAETMVNNPEKVYEALSEWLLSAQNIYLTLCLDVFSAACAPGVSAPQAMGLLPHTLLPFFRQVLQSGKVIGFDVAELNPTYDRDDQTAALAAYFISEVFNIPSPLVGEGARRADEGF